MTTKGITNWWALAFNGIIALLFGLMAIFSPVDTFKVIIMYFGIVMLIIGVAMFIGVYTSMKNKLNYGNDLITSIITIGLGIVLTFFTQRSLEIFAIVVGVWAIILGISQLIIMMNIQSSGDKKILLINGIITLAFGVLLFFNPFTLASIFIVLTGVLSVIIGVILIAVAIKIKNLQ